jgi:hypothetical protein
LLFWAATTRSFMGVYWRFGGVFIDSAARTSDFPTSYNILK